MEIDWSQLDRSQISGKKPDEIFFTYKSNTYA